GEISSGAFATGLPLGDRFLPTATVQIEGEEARAAEDHLASIAMVSTGYFATMRIPILAGRDFTDQDAAGSPNVAIVDETMARRYWQGASPIGRRVRMAAGGGGPDIFTVVGGVRAGKDRAPDEPPAPLLYLHADQRPLASLFTGVIVRTRGSPPAALAVLRSEIQSIDPRVAPLAVQTMDDYIRPATARIRMGAAVLGALALASLLLASL